MASLMGSIPVHHYDMQTANEVSDARMDLIFKVSEYLIRRLALYNNDITFIRDEILRNNGDIKEFSNQIITLEGWSTLFDAEPLAHGRRISSCLFNIVSSVNEFWRGSSEDNFACLRTVCQAQPGQPRQLLQKHFLFFRYLFAYLDYVGGVVQCIPFEQYNEYEELAYFLALMVATQFLIGDLLDLNTTPIGRCRTRLRNYDATLYGSVNELVALMEPVHRMWREARRDVTTDYMHADEPCANGDFSVLGQREVEDCKEYT